LDRLEKIIETKDSLKHEMLLNLSWAIEKNLKTIPKKD